MDHFTRMHRCLTESRVAVGMSLGANSPGQAELIVNGIESDFFMADLQHQPVTSADSINLLRAVQAADPDVTPLARVPDHSVYWIQQSLDAGYTGLIVPLVESAEQSRNLVRAAFYPPIGDRSSAGSIRASLYGLEPDAANDLIKLLPQIESAGGLDHVEEIVEVSGVSGVLVGPEDLSLSCGWRGLDLWSHRPFLDAIRRILAACRKNNKAAAILTGGYKEARKAGFDIIGIGSDIAMARVQSVGHINSTFAELRRPVKSG